MGKDTREEDIDTVVEALADTVERLRGISSIGSE
jgi:hypothetical protein